MKIYSPKHILDLLLKNGFILKRVKGSHHVLFNSQTNKTVIVPIHKKDLPIGTCLSILKQAGLPKDDL